MRYRLRMGWRAGALLALGWLLGGTSVCHAQLFPHLGIRRQKADCAQEPPFNKYIRQNYYGYYPTCWRAFPPGWACPCPNPALPNWEASKRETPLQPLEENFDTGTGEGMDDVDPGRAPAAPGRSKRYLPSLPGALCRRLAYGRPFPPAALPSARAPPCGTRGQRRCAQVRRVPVSAGRCVPSRGPVAGAREGERKASRICLSGNRKFLRKRAFDAFSFDYLSRLSH